MTKKFIFRFVMGTCFTLLGLFLLLIAHQYFLLKNYSTAIEAIPGVTDEFAVFEGNEDYVVQLLSEENQLEHLESLEPPKNVLPILKPFVLNLNLSYISIETIRENHIVFYNVHQAYITGKIRDEEDVKKIITSFPNVSWLSLENLPWNEDVKKIFDNSPRVHDVHVQTLQPPLTNKDHYWVPIGGRSLLSYP